MPSPSPEIIQLVSFFATAFTAPTFAKREIVLLGDGSYATVVLV